MFVTPCHLECHYGFNKSNLGLGEAGDGMTSNMESPGLHFWWFHVLECIPIICCLQQNYFTNSL